MTHEEKILATAYTGVMFVGGKEIGEVSALEEKALGHGVMDIMHADKNFREKVREALREDFVKMISRDDHPMQQMTWKDIKVIVTGADSLLAMKSKKELLEMGEEGYYTEILKEYEQFKKEGLI